VTARRFAGVTDAGEQERAVVNAARAAITRGAWDRPSVVAKHSPNFAVTTARRPTA
jgi:hypothetical protein